VWKEYAGGYSDWQRVMTSVGSEPAPARRGQKIDGRAKRASAGLAPAKSRLSFNEERELDELPNKIDVFEREQGQITQQLANAALYRDQPEQVKQLNLRFATLEAELASALSRWEQLEAKR